MFPEKFYTYLEENTLFGIKGGLSRPNFLNIWMVEVDKRVFARSWQKSERSWFTEFQRTGVGQIKYGDEILSLRGTKLDPLDPINKRISEAYLKKYDQPHNLEYAKGIAGEEYFDHCMEFIYSGSTKTET